MRYAAGAGVDLGGAGGGGYGEHQRGARFRVTAGRIGVRAFESLRVVKLRFRDPLLRRQRTHIGCEALVRHGRGKDDACEDLRVQANHGRIRMV